MMFAIGDREWPGLSKLSEEMGEVGQIIGKLMGTRGERRHWNVPDLKAALEDEIADVMAACNFVIDHCQLDYQKISARIIDKRSLFEKWHKSGDNSP